MDKYLYIHLFLKHIIFDNASVLHDSKILLSKPQYNTTVQTWTTFDYLLRFNSTDSS